MAASTKFLNFFSWNRRRNLYLQLKNIKNSNRLISSSILSQNNFNREGNNIEDEIPDSNIANQPQFAAKCFPKTLVEYRAQRYLKPEQPALPKSLNVAIIGEPNAGKSTLTNKLIKWRICSVSSKVHTTREMASAIMVEENTQIVFLDTPGLITAHHRKKHSLEPSLMMDPFQSLQFADIVAVLVDVSAVSKQEKLGGEMKRLLEKNQNKKSILILNKVDLLKKKRKLFEITENLTCGGFVNGTKSLIFEAEKKTENKFDKEKLFQKMKNDQPSESNFQKDDNQKKSGWDNFSDVFMISALDGTGIDDLRNYFLNNAVERKWLFHKSIITDQNPHEVGELIVREKLLEHLRQEIPYNLILNIHMWNVDSVGVLHIAMDVICPKKGHVKLLLGPEGKTINTIAKEARQELANAFRSDVSLKLIVKCSKK